jgi:serine/threonine protein kinase
MPTIWTRDTPEAVSHTRTCVQTPLVLSAVGVHLDSTDGCGTPAYAAPETFNLGASAASDQYSLVCTYQELLTGKRPFDGASLPRLLVQHTQEPPDLNPLPTSDRAAVGRALANRHVDQFLSCEAFVRALTGAKPLSWPFASQKSEMIPAHGAWRSRDPFARCTSSVFWNCASLAFIFDTASFV